MIKKNLGPFPTSYQLNRWADKVPGSRDSVSKVVGQTSNKNRSISHATSIQNIRRRQRKFGTGFAISKNLKYLNIHKY